ncbi:MAG: SAM-dependent methyltransferase [Halioglobus sp.]|nr:SAM-dependent methyltransferase [Halioglobus sp.]
MQLERTSAEALPEPHPDSLRHCARVTESLRKAIDTAGGSIGFGEFMQHALYAPGLGYYVAGARKFGSDGDFITAPEVSPLFGQVLATQCAEILGGIPGGNILELGAGSGALAVQILGKLQAIDCLPERYLILDVSAELRQRQQQLIGSQLPDLLGHVDWLQALPESFRGVVIANEVADALPVERFLMNEGEVAQLRVACNETGFHWQQARAPDWLQTGVRAIERYIGRELPSGYLSEFSPALHGWIGDIANSLQEGVVLLFDYGVARREYYAPDRHAGWLRCYFRHHAHDDPLLYPGIQDVTAWIDFTEVAEAAADAGMEIGGYVTQSQFLLQGGLADELADFDQLDQTRQFELSRAVKLLTLPGEMGEHFKCIALSKGRATVPEAMALCDRAHVL